MENQLDYLSKVVVYGHTDWDTSYTIEAESKSTGAARVTFEKPQSLLVESELVEILKSCRKARLAFKLAIEVENG